MANVLDILSTLLQKSADQNSAQNNIGPATSQQLNKVGATSADAVGPYQQGVIKALKDLGQQHVQDAVAQGADPINDIQNHPMMNSNDNPTQLLTGLIAAHVASQQPNIQNNSSQNTQQLPQQSQIKDNILNQLVQASSAPQGFMGRFGQAFNNNSGSNAAQLANLQAIATAAGITPEQQYQQAGAAELTQSAKQKELANQGRTPIQQTELMAANTAAQQKQIESQKAELDAEKSNLQALVKTQGDVISHPASMLMGGTGLKDIHLSIQQSMDRIKKLQDNLNSQSNDFAQKISNNNNNNSNTKNSQNITPDQARILLRKRGVKGY